MLVVSCRHMKCLDYSIFYLFPYKVTHNFDVLGPLMKYRVGNNVQSSITITVERNWMFVCNQRYWVK